MTTTDTTLRGDTAAPSAFAGARRAPSYIEDTTPPPADVIDILTPGLPEPEELHEDETTPEPKSEILDNDDLGELAVAAPAPVATKGVRGLVAKTGIKVGPGAREIAELIRVGTLRRDEETIRQATWSRAVGILVANPKGGVGKTPTALLLGGILAAVRGGSVCVVEVSDDPGALTFRSEGRATRGLGELVRDTTDIRSAGQLAGYTAPQSSFASVIGSVGPRPRLDGEHVLAVASVIDDYFGIRVMDSGNQPSSTAFHAAVETADVLVIPIFNAGDATLEAAALIDFLRVASEKGGQLSEHAIVVRLHDGRPENPQVVSRVDRILASYGLTHIHDIPYDPHIAERGQITLESLSTPTRDAITALAADVVRTLQSTVR